MNRRLLTIGAGLAGLAGLRAARAGTPPARMHRLALQIDSDDRRAQQGALGNAANYAAHYRAAGEAFRIEIVVFGMGFGMVRADMSMMKGDVETLRTALGDSLVIAACRNSRAAAAASEGRKPDDIPLLPGVGETPSGVVRLAELQEQGWSYIRP